MIDRMGQQLGNYRLIRLLGSGGFADVYLGEHVYLNRQAAIKVLQARLAQNDLQVFLAEARTIANLTHRNIVQVLEFGVERDIPFLVMAYAPNGTLRQRHPSGSRLSLYEVVSYVGQVADALQYAHDRKVIHRDVKPENMLVGQNDNILLTDFGIAAVAQSSRFGGQEVGGTIAYMAPEQLQGRANPASDQYALAVVAYEWLTGERPFNGSSAEIVGQHLSALPPSLRTKVPSLPPSVEQVVQTALNKNPQQRFQSVQEFANALAQASGVHQKFSASMDDTTQTSEAEKSTFVRQPPHQAYPSLRNTTSSNYPMYNVSQQVTPPIPPPPPDFTMQKNNGNIHTPHLNNSSMISGQFTPQVQPVLPVQKEKRRSNRGLMVAVIALVVILVAITSAGATYIFSGKQASSIGSGGQRQPTAISPQTGTFTIPTDTPTPPATNTSTPTAATTPTTPTTSKWGPGTKNQPLICITNCTGNDNSFDVTLTSIDINTSLGTMAWVFSITDRGNVCTSLSGSIKLVDPTGTSINADGGTFTQSSNINSGQTLPKTATFSALPKSGVLYEVDISGGCYGYSIFQPEQFQR